MRRSQFIAFILFFFAAAGTNVCAAEEIFSPHTLSTIELNKISDAAFSPEWLSLCHYKKNILGRFESQLDGKDFFLSPNGINDPEAELLSTVQILVSEEANGKSDVKTRFPARVRFIRAILSIHIEDSTNDDLLQFNLRMKSQSIAVVYSSYYINNPSSIFGHTFFKFSGGHAMPMEYGVNFIAHTGGDSFVTYLYKGLSGMYPGKYSVVNFHDKVREYNDFENRDLWVYTIKLNETEKELFTLHMWELMHSHYDYYFFTENCAYHTISALEPVFPEKKLTAKLNTLTLPIDTIKMLYAENLIDSYEYIPSLRNIFLDSYGRLSQSQKDSFLRIIKTKSGFEEHDAAVLAALHHYYNYRFPTAQLDVLNDPEAASAAAFKKNILFELSRRSEKSEDQPPHIPISPHQIHDTRRLALLYRYNSRTNTDMLAAEYRMAYHSMEDPVMGYPVNSEIEAGKISAGVYQPRHAKNPTFLINEIALIKIASYNDFSFYQHTPSWEIYGGMKRIIDARTDKINGLLIPEISGGIGMAYISSSNRRVDSIPSVLFYGLIGFSCNYASSLQPYRLSPGIGPKAGIKLMPLPSLLFDVSASFMQYYRSCAYSINTRSRFSITHSCSLYADICKFQNGYTCAVSGLYYF